MPFSSMMKQRKPFSLVVAGAPDPSVVSRKDAYLINHDLRPVPPSERTWSSKNYILFWAADSVNLSSMMIASTGVAAGMTWWQTFLAVMLGYSLTAIFVVLSARVGASCHTGFPVLARPAFGLYGAVWPVLNRVVVAILWFAFQTWVGGECVTLLLSSLAPRYVENTAGQLSGLTRTQFTSFIVYWIIQFPITFVSPQKIKHLFTVKAITAPIAVFGLLGWAVSRGGGGNIIHASGTLTGSELGWQFVITTMSQMANMITLALNAADYARLSTSRAAVTLPQLITIPVLFSVISLVGIFISSSASVLIGGDPVWNPLDIMTYFLSEDPYSPGARAGVFFISLAFIIAQLGTNIAANSVAVGSDLTSLMPRYISIVRGQVLCALISLVICPWYFTSSSSSFSNYLSAYSVLLAPILGVVLTDAYILRRGWIHVPSLFSWESTTRGPAGELTKSGNTPRGMYTFNAVGVNYRAYCGYLAGCAVNLPGFVAAVSSTSTAATIPIGLVRVYDLAFFSGSISAGIVYLLINTLHPVEGGVPVWIIGWKGVKRSEETDFDGLPFEAHYAPDGTAYDQQPDFVPQHEGQHGLAPTSASLAGSEDEEKKSARGEKGVVESVAY